MGWNIVIQAHCLPFNLLATSYGPSHIYVGYRNNMSQHSIYPPLSQIYFPKQHALCADYISTPLPKLHTIKMEPYEAIISYSNRDNNKGYHSTYLSKWNIIVLWNILGFIHGLI